MISKYITRGGSRTAATAVTKHSILDVAAALYPPLITKQYCFARPTKFAQQVNTGA